MVRALTPKPRVASLTRVGVTRAHLALGKRPELLAALQGVPAELGRLLSARLDAEVRVQGKLLDGAVRSPGNLTFPAAFGLVALDAVGGFAVVEVETPLVAALVDRMAGGPGEALPPMPITEGEEVGLSLLLLDALAALRPTPLEQAFAPRLARVVRSAAELSAATDLRLPHLAVQLQIECGAIRGRARLLVPASALRCWLATGVPSLLPPHPDLAAASVALSLCVGRAHLSPRDLTSLQPGDVVLLDDLVRRDGALAGPARLSGTAFALAGTLEGPRFTFASTRITQENPMTVPTEALRVPELPIDLEVELGRIRVTLGELAALQPGSVLPLHLTAGEPVHLRLGESTLAVVELVDIEGEIGARILRLTKRGAP